MADRYWVGGSGNSNDTTHWSATSGGAGSAGVPTSADNVIFDSNSSAANAAYVFTVNATFGCLDFTMGGPGGGNKVTWAGSSNMYVYGNTNLSGGTAGITNSFTGALIMFKGSGTQTVTANGVVLARFYLNGNGTTQLLDTLEVTTYIQKTAGTFNANSQLVKVNGAATIQGDITFYDLTLAGTNVGLTGNIVVSHTFVVAGTSATARAYIRSSTIGTQETITITGTTGNSYQYVDFRDINLYDAAGTVDLSAITGGSGDCGGNSGITFTPGANQFWYKASGAANSWATAGNWYLGTGGTGGAGRVPLPQDTAIFDDLSFGAAGMTITQNMPRIPTTTFAGVDGLHPVANTPTFTTSTAASVFGSLTLVAGMTLTASTQTYTFEGRGSYTLTSGGKTWAKAMTLNAPGGTLTLADALTSATGVALTITNGTLSNGTTNIISFGRISVGTTGTIALGSATHLLTGTGTVFTGTGAITAGTYTLKITDTSNTAITFAGAAKTYNNVWFDRGASTATNTITGLNTYTSFKDTGTAAHTNIFPNGTTNIGTLDLSGAGSGHNITLQAGSGTATLNVTNSPDLTYITLTNTIVTGPWATAIKTIFGLAKTSVKTVNGLAIASVKSFNGLV